MEHTEFVAALRAIADFYEDHPGCPLPYLGPEAILPIYALSGAEALADVARQLGRATKGGDDMFFWVERRFGAVGIRAMDYREKVCTRVVTGKTTVTELVPDPNAPQVKQTREVEQVEWRCPDSLLRATATAEVPA